MRQLSFKFKDETDGTSIEFTTDNVVITHILADFQRFLAGCGYQFSQDEELVLWDHSLTVEKTNG